MAERPKSVFRRVAALIVCAALGACANQAKRHEADMIDLLRWLPGSYDNALQVQEGGEAAEQRLLTIVPVYAPRLGRHVYYVHEATARNPGRAITQRLVSFEVVKGAGIVQSVWSLTDPGRWRDAHLDPDLFKALMPPDFEPVVGCELQWRREGERFLAHNDPARCRELTGTGTSVPVDVKIELGPEEYVVTTSRAGSAPATSYRFRKRAW